jgi:hypothetical protein
MNIFTRIADAFWRFRFRLALRRHERESARAYRERAERNGWFVGCLALVACLSLAGCHGAERATRTALDVTAHAVAAADTVVAREYADAAREQLAAATDLDDYHRRMRRWDRAEEALRTVAQALYAAEAGLDAADATSTRGALACVYTAAVDLVGALSALDVPIPQALARAVDTLGAFVGECRPPEAATPAGGTP